MRDYLSTVSETSNVKWENTENGAYRVSRALD